jgi:ankyrin repeat protein
MISGINNGCKILLTGLLFFKWHPTVSFLWNSVGVRFLVTSNSFHTLYESTQQDIGRQRPATLEHIESFSVHDNNEIEQEPIDKRPYEQRTKGPRQARRLNHAFRYLYRNASEFDRNSTAFEFLSEYYTTSEILEMNQTFPPLLDLNVSRHLHPKVRFLHETLQLDRNDHDAMRNCNIPPQYFGLRLEKTVAPRHAFLVYTDLPHGNILLEEHSGAAPKNDNNKPVNRFTEFLLSCRQTKRFCALCNQWRREQQQGQTSHGGAKPIETITSKQIEAFDSLFGRGILAAARDDLVQWNNTWPLNHINISSSEILRLMIQHGANPLERDIRGTTLLHWAAGTGNLKACEELISYFPNGLLERTERDGATPLHWAAAGANAKEFGTGGHAHVCQHILSLCGTTSSSSMNVVGASNVTCTAKELVNTCTYDGNSPLMWAAWSGSLDTVKMMVRHRARCDITNRNGCSVAHWAASGGDLDVCKYLAEVVNVNFFEPNHGGNTPLAHAVAFGRAEVVNYIRELAERMGESILVDEAAARLAADFVGWDGTDVKRRKVLQLFQDYDWDLLNGQTTACSTEDARNDDVMLLVDGTTGIDLED